MSIGCKNCGGHFSAQEMQQRKPPVHPWPLTDSGRRMLAANRESGVAHPLCPACGCMTLAS